MQWNQHEYYVCIDGMSWDEAKAACEDAGGYLVTVTTSEEADFIKTLISAKDKSAFWMGGILQDNEWTWITGERFDYADWEAGEPNNYLGRGEDCITIQTSTLTWYDSLRDGDPTGIQTSDVGYICEWGETDRIAVTDEEIHQLLLAHYANTDVTVMTGISEGDIYNCDVRCGVPGNPNASQRIYSLMLNKTTGEVTEENIITNTVRTYDLW